MGPKEKTNSVVDHQLRVHCVRNLRVADTSVMLMIPSANPNASTLMIGEKATDMIIHDRLHY
jgi:choline dehydrogenase